MQTVIHVQSLNKSFGGKQALFNLGLTVDAGEMVALIGPSGSGKSTLLRHLSGLACGDRGLSRSRRPATSDAGQAGAVHILNRCVQSSGRLDPDVRRLRASIGYIFQQFNLVGRMSVLNNVLMGRLGRLPRWRGTLGLFTAEDRELAMASLERVGLADRAWQRASTLSGGQQQRVAIARALTQQAELILADEPIASLDPESARKVMDILRDINETDGKTVVVTLHQVDYAARYCGRVIALKSGRIHFDGAVDALTGPFLNELYGGDLDASLMLPESRMPRAPRRALDLVAA
ncbi:phosphonate ABC transporter ATP-binding protein [Allopusillimonas soli]|uniref:Phosphonate ABC transporter ATP-binding protein n=1 Tax=Allopusillimonas soli TaxID=659016 RepID=A0A853FF44_9BURK|nr:phosphonate ABC transporter ATP-binding protein [Allopusillimonas soli]NYT37440.1 phosphonate ABC transporter ATP-binding protein [Allopusillimonas soli]TEA74579.1 phosphonate ABC transporter ATP-binding protein [Allopusillimonas soli]